MTRRGALRAALLARRAGIVDALLEHGETCRIEDLIWSAARDPANVRVALGPLMARRALAQEHVSWLFTWAVERTQRWLLEPLTRYSGPPPPQLLRTMLDRAASHTVLLEMMWHGLDVLGADLERASTDVSATSAMRYHIGARRLVAARQRLALHRSLYEPQLQVWVLAVVVADHLPGACSVEVYDRHHASPQVCTRRRCCACLDTRTGDIRYEVRQPQTRTQYDACAGYLCA